MSAIHGELVLAWSVACSWRIAGGGTRDVVRAFEDDGVLVCALANAYDSGFSTCWPRGSAHLLDLFEAAWHAKGVRETHQVVGGRLAAGSAWQTPGAREKARLGERRAGGSGGELPTPSGGAEGASNRARLRAAFDLAARAFVESEVVVAPRDVDFPDCSGAGSLLVAAITPTNLELAWLGAGIALVRRGDQVLAINRPHTVASQVEGDGWAIPQGLGHILTRSLQETDTVPDVASLTLAHGDLVVLSATDRGPYWRDVLARFSGRSAESAPALARALVHAPASVTHEPFAACVVACVGSRGYRG